MSLRSCLNSFPIISWFLIQINASLLSGADDEFQNDLVCGNETNKNRQEKVLAVTIHNKLNFTKHLLNIIKNANSNLYDQRDFK